MSVWEWVTAVLAIWGAVSILVAIAWGLAGKRIFRKPPTPVIHLPPVTDADKRFVAELKRRREEMGGA